MNAWLDWGQMKKTISFISHIYTTKLINVYELILYEMTFYFIYLFIIEYSRHKCNIGAETP